MWGAACGERVRPSRAGKAHLRRAILGQEEALRLHAVCRALRRVDLLQAVLAQALRRSLAKYSELDLEDDFFEATEAPDIQREQPGPSGWVCPGWGRGGRPRPLAVGTATASTSHRAEGPKSPVGAGRMEVTPPTPLPALWASPSAPPHATPRRSSSQGGGQAPPTLLHPSCIPWGPRGLGAMSPRLSPALPFALSAKTHRRPEVRAPSFSQVKVADIFHRLVSSPSQVA